MTRPEWIRYYDQSQLERDNGRALLGLALNGGSYDEAERRLRSSIQAFPAGHHRGKALAMANLATLTMAHDDPLHGAELGRDALAAVGAARSDRVSDAFRQLHGGSAAPTAGRGAGAERGYPATGVELNRVSPVITAH